MALAVIIMIGILCTLLMLVPYAEAITEKVPQSPPPQPPSHPPPGDERS